MRGAAARALRAILESAAPAGVPLGRELGPLPRRDQALLRELVLGTLRWLRRLDQLVAAASERPLARIDPELLTLLRLGAYQIFFLDRIPAHAAVHETVALARRASHRGGAAFVNAVLRRLAGQPRLESWPVVEPDARRRLAIETSHPDLLVERWLARFGELRTRELLAANNRPKPLHLLAFAQQGGRDRLAEELRREGVETEPSRLSPCGLVVRAGDPLASAAFRRGGFYLQDEASQVAALLPTPRRRERILDAAAAPGGKSLALVAHEPSVRPVLADASPARLGRLRDNLNRLGLALPVIAADARRPALAGGFDRVVLDLPCSGTGTLRKHPELKWRVSAAELERLSAQALAMLLGCAPLVLPGGLMVVITCSLEAEENEDLVASFLLRRGDFEPARLEDGVLPELAPGIEGPGRWRVLPGGAHDGFTVHVLERRPAGGAPCRGDR